MLKIKELKRNKKRNKGVTERNKIKDIDKKGLILIREGAKLKGLLEKSRLKKVG